MTPAFASLIGQNSIKRKLSFYLEAAAKTKVFPFLNFVGAKGLGKTAFARAMGEQILDENGVRRKFVEINCSTIRSAKQFFEQIFIVYLHDQEATVFFDEAHELPKDLTMALLTVLNTEKSSVVDFTYNDSVLRFDFKKLSFFFGTSESHRIFAPLRDRLTPIEFTDYSKSELEKIFAGYLPNTTFEPEALQMLAETSRGNARNCVLRAKEVEAYCARKGSNYFTVQDATEVCDILDILPHGLNRIEMKILRTLRENGRCTLAMLAAKTGLSRTAIQRDFEQHLMKLGLMTIDGLRAITVHGCKLVDTIPQKHY